MNSTPRIVALVAVLALPLAAVLATLVLRSQDEPPRETPVVRIGEVPPTTSPFSPPGSGPSQPPPPPTSGPGSPPPSEATPSRSQLPPPPPVDDDDDDDDDDGDDGDDGDDEE